MADRASTARVAAAAYLLLGAAHLLTIVLAPEVVVRTSQALLMPALAVAALRPGLARGVRWPLTTALLFSWLGDTLPGVLADGAGFLAMVGCFLLAQLAWMVVLWRWRGDSAVAQERWRLAPYLLVAAVLLALCLPHAGALALPVVGYAVALLGTTVLATGTGSAGTTGGALFLVSDGMIAVFTFLPGVAPADPWRGLVVMSTYIAAQGLLVLAVRRQGQPSANVSSSTVAGSSSRSPKSSRS